MQDILSCIDLLHAKHQEDTFSVQELSAFFKVCFPALSEKKMEAYQEILATTESCELAQGIGQELLGAFRKRRLMSTLAQAAWEASEGHREAAEVLEISHQLEDNDSLGAVETNYFISDNLAELKHRTLEKPGLRWRLTKLNQALGSLRRGNFGFVFARPETGKTTFLASEVSFMASQANGPILWFNNEEEGDAVMTRIFQATLGITLPELYSDVDQNQIVYNELTKGNIRLYDDASISKQTIEAVCEEMQPSLIVIDQIDKIKGFKADRDDLLLGSIYQWVREISKRYCPSIGICQSDGTGEGQKWLTMAHVANAKTSKQAEADWILGIGKTFDPQEEYVRYLNISKNKLMGDEDSDPAMRHGRFKALINPMIARYEDLL